MKKISLICFLVFFIGNTKLSAQDSILKKTDSAMIFIPQKDSVNNLQKPKWNYTLKSQVGRIFKTNVFLKNVPGSADFIGTALQITKQTNGSQEWNEGYNFPSYGFGVGYFNMLEQDHMNNPFTFYGIFSGPIKRKEKWNWNYELNVGIAYKWRTFSEAEGYYNITFGSKSSVYFSLGTHFVYHIGNHFDVGLGAALNHFSNGGFKMPNKGLNEYSLQLSLTYVPERTMIEKSTTSKKTDLFNSLDIYTYYGYKNVIFTGGYIEDYDRRYEGFLHNVYGLDALYMYQYGPKSSIGLGSGITFDGQYNYYQYVEDGIPKEKKRYSASVPVISIFPSYRLQMGKFSVHADFGAYLFSKMAENGDSAYFQRIGFRYQIGENIFAGIGLRATKFYKADYVEFRLGYRVFNRKR